MGKAGEAPEKAGEALVRARHIRMLLEEVDKLPADQSQSIRYLIGAEILDRIAKATITEWLPVSLHLAMGGAIYQVLGEQAGHRLYRAHQLRAFGGPLLGPLLHAAGRLFGLDPGGLLKRFPQGWDLVFRGFGTWTIDRSAPGEMDLRLSGLPRECLQQGVLLRSVAVSGAAVFDVCRVPGTFQLTKVEGGDALYAARWVPRGG